MSVNPESVPCGCCRVIHNCTKQGGVKKSARLPASALFSFCYPAGYVIAAISRQQKPNAAPSAKADKT
jgi:hypothetical protein